MNQLLSKRVADATGYTEEEAKQILLKKMDRDAMAYKEGIKARSVNPESWAAITLCYQTDGADVFIKAVGMK